MINRSTNDYVLAFNEAFKDPISCVTRLLEKEGAKVVEAWRFTDVNRFGMPFLPNKMIDILPCKGLYRRFETKEVLHISSEPIHSFFVLVLELFNRVKEQPKGIYLNPSSLGL